MEDQSRHRVPHFGATAQQAPKCATHEAPPKAAHFGPDFVGPPKCGTPPLKKNGEPAKDWPPLFVITQQS